MDTNFQMMRKLNDEYDKIPHQRGFISIKTARLIRETLCLSEMENVLQLRNLRDFVVLFLHSFKADEEDLQRRMERMDKISAITHIIDLEIVDRGGEV